MRKGAPLVVDCHNIRGDFPGLRGGLVYLDSAASTLKPYRVVEAMSVFASERYANVHRGVYRLAAEATREYEDAHRVVADFLCAGEGEIVFAPQGTTSAMHLAVGLLEHNGLVGRGDIIVVPGDAHNSNLLPWRQLAGRVGAELRVVPVDGEGVPRWDVLDELLASGRVRVVAVTHVSNVTGYESPLAEIAAKARKAGALVVVDGAQSVPHLRVCPRALGVDMLAFSAHKMLGPTGIGVLYMREKLARELEPPYGGGGTIRDVRAEGDSIVVDWEEPPWRFEAGTPPIIEAVGLRAAVEYLEGVGMGWVERHERELVGLLLEELERIPQATIIGPRGPARRRGIVTFNLDGHHPHSVGVYLGSLNIAVRSGTHCANLLYHSLGLHTGGVRASFYLYNCPEDVERLVGALRMLLS